MYPDIHQSINDSESGNGISIPPSHLSLERILSGLRSKIEPIRIQYADELIKYMNSLSKEQLYGELFQKSLNDTNRTILELLNSSDINEKMGALLAIDRLIEFEGEELMARLSRYAQYLRISFPSSDPQVTILAAKVLGKLAFVGGPLAAEFIDVEINRALEWIQIEKSEHRRHAAILIFYQLALNVPMFVLGHLPQILEHIWPGLRDSKISIRMASYDTLQVCINIISQRYVTSKFQWYHRSLEELLKNLKLGQTESIHGALLILQVLIRYRFKLMEDQYQDICKLLAKHRDHKDALVKCPIILIIPELAEYNLSEFSKFFLEDWMFYFISLLKKDKERSTVFVGITRLVSVIGQRMLIYIEPLFTCMKECLSKSSDNRSYLEAPIFDCIDSIIKTLGRSIPASLTEEMLQLVLSGELSVNMHQTLLDFSNYLPSYRPYIQDCLLDILSRILCKKTLSELSSKQITLFNIDTINHYIKPEMLILALDILGQFQFGNPIMIDLLLECCNIYLDYESSAVRKQAILSICRILTKDSQFRVKHKSIVVDIIHKLLLVSTYDPEPDVRIAVFHGLEKEFDDVLAYPDNIKIIFLAINDENFDLQLTCIDVIHRLAILNPAYVLPPLRHVLVLLLNTMKLSSNSYIKKNNANLLSRLILLCYSLITPYAEPIFSALKPCLREDDEQVVTSILIAMGDLFTIGEDFLRDKVDEIFPILLEIAQDQGSLEKRIASLRALGQIARSTGFVVQPFLKYPLLFDIIVNIIKSEQVASIRREAIKLFGIVGAIDPDYFKEKDDFYIKEAFLGLPPEGTVTTIGLYNISTNSNDIASQLEDSHAVLVIQSLLHILKDTTLLVHHPVVLQSAIWIFKTLGMKSALLLPLYLPSLIQVIAGCQLTMVEFYYAQLVLLVQIVKVHIRAYAADILKLIQEHWNTAIVMIRMTAIPSEGAASSTTIPQAFQIATPGSSISGMSGTPISGMNIATAATTIPSNTLPLTLISLVANIVNCLKGEFRVHMNLVFPWMLKVLEDSAKSEDEWIIKILEAIPIFGDSLRDYLHLLFPNITKLAESIDQSFEVRKSALICMRKICLVVSFEEHSTRMIHPMIRILQSSNASNVELYQYTMDVLIVMLYRLKNGFKPFVGTVNRYKSKSGKIAIYDTLVERYLNIDGIVDCMSLLSSKEDKEIFETLLSTNPSSDALHTTMTMMMDTMTSVATAMMGRRSLYTNENNSLTNIDDSVHPLTLAMKRLTVNQHNLKRAWDSTQIATRDDWFEWMRRLSTEVLRESSSHSLRACANLAGVYYPLSRDLFNDAFLACWTELSQDVQNDFVTSLETALSSSNIPPEIIQILLNLAEHLEREGKSLHMDISLLAEFASRCHVYAKALHYYELEYQRNPPADQVIESLITVNSHLQLPDAASGVLTHAQRKFSIQLQEDWYEKLQRWDDALSIYEKKQEMQIQSTEDGSINEELKRQTLETTLGIMRCLHALGDWDRLANIGQELWQKSQDDNARRLIAPWTASALWGLGEWDLLDEYISVIRSDTPDGAFYRAVLAVHQDKHRDALLHIEKARDLLDTELTALLRESYNRAYNVAIRVQMLSELEEILEYKQCIDRPRKQEMLRATWYRRLKGCQRNVDVWQGFLKVRALAISPLNDVPLWIKFANLCRKNNQPILAQKILTMILSRDSVRDFSALNEDDYRRLLVNNPSVGYVYLKHLWTIGQSTSSYEALQWIIDSLTIELESILPNHILNDSPLLFPLSMTPNPLSKLLSRCLLRQSEWKRILVTNDTNGSLSEGLLMDMINTRLDSARYDSSCYKCWHSWALSNFETVSYFERNNEHRRSDFLSFIVNAVQGFYRSVALSRGFSLQDTLRLLTLWFKYGSNGEVAQAIGDGFSTVPIDTWLHVIPQLIARIHAPSPQIRKLIHQLLLDVGKHHPQAIIFSLTVASKSISASRKSAASAMLDKMRLHSSKLVDQAILVSQELIRVAILWAEMWHSGLEEASRLYYGQKNITAMFNVLEPLHQMLERNAETLREISFRQTFGKELKGALELCQSYKRTGNTEDIHQAWELYYQVFRKLNKQLQQLVQLELQYVSPSLLAAQDLELAVPGTYRHYEPVIRIVSFHPTMQVINSKQRPRKLKILGSDGKEYQYLLKGHEDLRQDERVMQLFGLVNSLLATDKESKKRHLSIQRYPVIPLSPNSGLIGWVPHCDTIHSLIREYREENEMPLNMEHRLMLQMASDYDRLTLLEKMEVFEYALNGSSGQDLSNVLWSKSSSSEEWLDRRTNYIRSLAVMSMVGYILGLGDRHPSNLMMDRETGRIIHIDFGDCFEVAMHREKFPEKIPFRLTRMLVKAMEVSGVDGSFRNTCIHVMRVLRNNKDSLMAVLEAFVYDPLISWRLLAASIHHPAVGTEEGPLIVKSMASMEDVFDTENIPSFFRRTSIAEAVILEQDNDIETNKQQEEGLNTKALSVVSRVSNKLTGKDFKTVAPLDVENQVDRLISQATSIENLCQSYVGWCPFW